MTRKEQLESEVSAATNELEAAKLQLTYAELNLKALQEKLDIHQACANVREAIRRLTPREQEGWKAIAKAIIHDEH